MSVRVHEKESLIRRIIENRDEYLFILPALSFTILFTFVASGYSISLSLWDYRLNTSARPFVGLLNYLRLYTDPTFYSALLLSMAYLATSVPLTIAVGLFLAMVIKQKLVGLAVFRTFYVLPWVIPMVAAGYMLQWIFADIYGVLNRALEALGLPTVAWLSQPVPAFATIVLSSIWKTYTFGMLVLLAALQGIPIELYESASIDGAGRGRQFLAITLPLLKPQILTLLILRSIWAFSMVDLVFVMTKGGPVGATNLLSYHMYNTAFRFGLLSYATAMGFNILVINIVLTFLYYRTLQSGRNE